MATRETIEKLAIASTNILVKAFWYGKVLQLNLHREDRQYIETILREWASTLSPTVAKNILYDRRLSSGQASPQYFLTPAEKLLDWSKFKKSTLTSPVLESDTATNIDTPLNDEERIYFYACNKIKRAAASIHPFIASMTTHDFAEKYHEYFGFYNYETVQISSHPRSQSQKFSHSALIFWFSLHLVVFGVCVCSLQRGEVASIVCNCIQLP
jgi:hypothetical protein